MHTQKKLHLLVRRLYDVKTDLLLVFVATFIIATYWQFTRTIGDPDGFYHAKIALLISQGELFITMPWMQFSTLRDAFTDHHLLYHILLAPFVAFGKPLVGVKLAQVAFTAGFFTTFYWFMRRMNFNAPWVYTILLLLTSSFTFRLSLIKANSISLIILLLILYALIERRVLLLALLNAVYVWLYGGWFFSLVLTVLYIFISLVYERMHRVDVPWYRKIFKRSITKVSFSKILFASILGSTLGLVINPYWPANINFYWQQVWQIAIVNFSDVINVGGEWNSLGFTEFFEFYSLILIPFVIGLFLIAQRARSVSKTSWFLLCASLLTIFFTIKSRRYIELSAPFALLFAASIWSDVFPKKLVTQIIHSWTSAATHIKHLFVWSLIIGIVVFLFVPGTGLSSIKTVRSQINNGGILMNRYKPASEWLQDNTPYGSIVVHSDWDDWPILFYHNTHNRYIIGLDPTFMYNYDNALYREWADMTAKGESENVVELIRERLHGDYIIIEKDHVAMQNLFATNIYFRLVYEDDEAWVFEPVSS